MNNLTFNSTASTVMHIDLNSCFATIEQQANPHLRGKPIAVAAYTSPYGCIVAPSVEAKRYGIKVGMRVKDGKSIYPKLIVLPPDPWKYRMVHLKLRQIVSHFTADYSPKSIDEFVLHLGGYPCLKEDSIHAVAKKIKLRIKDRIGEWVTVSVGIAPNRFLAKLAAGLHKPDGLDEINLQNHQGVYSRLGLDELPGIKSKNIIRLNRLGIYSVQDFYEAPIFKLRAAFESILGYYWYLRLKGWEIDAVAGSRKSYGNSYALPQPLTEPEKLAPILTKLVEKMSSRIRRAGYKAQGVHLGIGFRDGSFWHKGKKTPVPLFDSRDIYKQIYQILDSFAPRKPVRDLAVSVFNLTKEKNLQLELFGNINKKFDLMKSVDKLNERWGEYVLYSGRMVNTQDKVPDRIAFGGVKELEEFVNG